MHSIRWILFDWGDVLVRYRPLGFPKLAERLGVKLDEMVNGMEASALVRQLCVGEAAPEDLSDWIAERYDVRLSEADFIAMFAADVSERLPGTETLVAELGERYRLSILSNTFFGHWHQLLNDPFYAAFERPMASHILQAEKPDPVIYERALHELNAEPSQVVFVDDKQPNVDAARALGIAGIFAPTPEATRAGLVELGCLNAGS